MKNFNLTKTLLSGLALATALYPQAFACEEGEIIGAKTGNCIPASGNCGSGCSYQIDSQGNLTISGNGSIGAGAFAGNLDIVNVKIEYGINTIVESAFARASNMKQVDIPNSVKTIQHEVFSRTNLTSLYIPDSVTSLSTYGMCRTCQLEYLYIPENSTNDIVVDIFGNSQNMAFVVPANMKNSSWKSLNFQLNSANIYCTGAQIESGLCTSNVSRYEKDGDNYIVYNQDGTIKDILHDFHDFSNTARTGFEEKTFAVNEDGSIMQVGENGALAKYDAHGNLVYTYGHTSDGSVYTYDANGKLIGLKKKSAFTPAEAAAFVKKGNVNTVTLTFK